ncbi:uncharacterized protein LOC119671579 [Teleopsis dalmanni]|uniref:uncharacterized protein LOC119670674 n=1 Tax=Teleopsis dalmanni TaxID=139649 RepID=UPI0018CCA7ED|nr:uncharacterized protein LOC119670674 [Teleopsis dalmanni]XP_037936971.1 uncharacterized protein LOC119670675 [Teleopsis dalmanni]XP_037938210.1 uncharacterized protein LOC119671579 [Teleopsis dalmanni]
MELTFDFWLITILTLIFLQTIKSDMETKHRRKAKEQARTLLFPPTAPTRVQFIGGIGIPVEDLHFESVTSGYVLKVEYFLPTKAQEIRPYYLKPQSIHRRSTNETLTLTQDALELAHSQSTQMWTVNGNESSNFGDNFKSQHRNASIYRWIIYKAIEIILNRSGLPGHICLMRSICEHASVPLHYESGMLAEILHIVLTPSTSRDDFRTASDKDYLKAEILGRSGGNCEFKYSECTVSPIDQISIIFD